MVSFVPQGKHLKLRSLLRKIAKKLSLSSLADAMEDPFQNAARREGIEFVLFLTPAQRPVEIPYIANVWDIQHRLQPWFPELSYKGEWLSRETLFSAYLRQASYVITPNQAGMREISFFYQIPPERIRLLMHPSPEIPRMPSEGEVAAVLQKYKIAPGYLFYPAQFWAHKNHANLFLALQCLRDKYQMHFHLVLVGSDKGNRQHIQDLAQKLGINEQIHFLGFVPREDLIALYRAAFALVYVTLCGPENLPPLEAFVCGCPVIASNVSGAQEQLGDAALLVNGLNADEIAAAVKKVKDDPDLRKALVDKGALRAKKFTGPDFIKGVFSMLDEFESIRRNWK
jgi:glycosyltransferase involved in cell wall biosynthesis